MTSTLYLVEIYNAEHPIAGQDIQHHSTIIKVMINTHNIIKSALNGIKKQATQIEAFTTFTTTFLDEIRSYRVIQDIFFSALSKMKVICFSLCNFIIH